MKSFEHDYYIHQPISQGLLMSVRSLSPASCGRDAERNGTTVCSVQ
jgi:hypothetical protein